MLYKQCLIATEISNTILDLALFFGYDMHVQCCKCTTNVVTVNGELSPVASISCDFKANLSLWCSTGFDAELGLCEDRSADSIISL